MPLITNRSRRRILASFRELLLINDYCDISVANIIAHADVSKTTFYRYYHRKLDVFVEMHDAIFDLCLQDFNHQADWLSLEPRKILVQMALKAASKTGRRPSMAYQLRNDWPHAVRLLKQNLANAIDAKLNAAFPGQAWRISQRDLTDALAALYSDYLVQVNNAPNTCIAQQRAISLQCFTQAMIKASI